MKKSTPKFLLFVLLFFSISASAQQNIDKEFFGQNAWFLDGSNPVDLNTYWDDIRESAVRYVRIGGIDANFNKFYDVVGTTVTNVSRLVTTITNIRNKGMEPVVQISFIPPGQYGNTLTIAQQASIAQQVATMVNASFVGQEVLHWRISNEPDGNYNITQPWGFVYNNASVNAQDIYNYISQLAPAIRNSNTALTFIIMGSDLTFYREYPGNQMITALTSGTYNILPFIDV